MSAVNDTNIQQIKHNIETVVDSEVQFRIDKLIVMLSESYNIPKVEIYQKIMAFDDKLQITESKDSEQIIDINNFKCLGRTKFSTQCSRSRQPDSQFCGSHINKLPYGKIDDSIPTKSSFKKRGRPKKNTTE